MSEEAGLFTWDKPAYACLATRVPTGTFITRERLGRAERAEEVLAQMGFRDFRVRLLEDGACIQVTAGQMHLAFQKREKIIDALRADFSRILLDLEERKASEQEGQDGQ